MGGPYTGSIQHSLTWLIIGHDPGLGTLELRKDCLRVNWPGGPTDASYKPKVDRLKDVSAALGSVFVTDLKWSAKQSAHFTTVHPLGGCRMGDDASKGVVDDLGRVFVGSSGTQVYPNLFVLDGSILPRSLGANPLLTITAISERAMAVHAAA